MLGPPLDVLLPGRDGVHREHHLPWFAAGPAASRRMADRREVYGRRRSGEEFPAEAGEARRFVGQVQDISVQKQALGALARQAGELQQSSAVLKQFAYVTSHDLQEPLRTVARYTQLLARRYGVQLVADAHRWIGHAVDGAHRMQALINDLLAVSRLGTRGGALVPTDCNIARARVLDTLVPTIAETAASVTVGALPVVQGDATQLDELLQNVLGNALKFHRPHVPPCVHVAARPLVGAAGRRMWKFRVHDNGIGIDIAHADQVFAMFQRLHTREEYPGTGIGLAICRKVVERHGGRIWVESAPGDGTTICFTLPDVTP